MQGLGILLLFVQGSVFRYIHAVVGDEMNEIKVWARCVLGWGAGGRSGKQTSSPLVSPLARRECSCRSARAVLLSLKTTVLSSKLKLSYVYTYT